MYLMINVIHTEVLKFIEQIFSINTQKYVEVEFCNQENMDKFKNEVANADLYNKLDLNINTDPNYNYEIFSKHLQAAKSKHIPKKIKKFNKRKHKKEKWMTNELLIKIVEKNKLYRWSRIKTG